MASELSQLIESELRKAESANKPDEHQRRLTSLRVKTGLDQPPPTLLQRVCTTKRQIIAGGVVTILLLTLILITAVSHKYHTRSQGSVVGSAFVPQPGHVDQDASTDIATFGGAGDENLQNPPASGTTETDDDATKMPVMDTTEYGNSTLSQQTQAESQEHKQQLNLHSEIAPSAAEAMAPSEDMAPSPGPALGPIGAKAPAQSLSAVPGPAPTGER
ncbi:hypothetical protein ABBQ38_005061 [Trebouxia sp. C0009 RCD-2024]